MNANHPHEALSAYLDGELGVEERSLVEVHLRHCAPCAALLADLELLARSGADERIPAVPADMGARIMEHIPPGVVQRRRHWIHRVPLAAAASLAAAAVIWVVFQDAPPLSPDPEFGRDIASQEALPAPPEKPAQAEGLADGAGAPRSDEVSRQEAEKAQAMEEPPERKKSATTERFADEDTATGKKGDLPAAPSTSQAAKPKPADRADGAEQEELRLAGGPEPIQPPPDSVKERELARRAVGRSARESDAVAALPSTVTALSSADKQNEPMESSPVAKDALPAPGPTLVLREAGQEIRLTEGGMLTLQASQYDCTILLPADRNDADSPPDANRQLLVADSHHLPEDGEVMSLFQGDSLSGERADQEQPALRSRVGGVTELQEAPAWTVTLQTLDGHEQAVPQARAAEIRRQLHSMVQERHRSQLQAQCGPLPQPPDDDPGKP